MVNKEKFMNKIKYKKVYDFFGINPSIISMMIMVILIGLGEKMAERFLPLYLIALGGSIYSVGILNGMDNLLSALYSFPGGYITDRIGYKKALIAFTVVAMFGYLLVILIPLWQAVLIGSIFFISWTAITLPAIMSMVSKVMKKEKRTMGVSLHSFVRRIPMALGPLIGGLMIVKYGEVRGVRYAFITAFLLGIFAIFFVYKYMKDDNIQNNNKKSVIGMFKNINPNLRNLLVSDILVRFAEQIPYAFVVVWVVKNKGLSAFQFGILSSVEMVTAMLVYIPVAYFADKYKKKPFVIITFGFFTLFPLFLYFSTSYITMIIAFIIRGLKEFGEPTRKALIMDLAPENEKAGTFGAYYLLRDVVVSIAAFASPFLWEISPKTNFMAAFIFGLIGTIVFAVFGKDLKSDNPNR